MNLFLNWKYLNNIELLTAKKLKIELIKKYLLKNYTINFLTQAV